MIRHAGEIAIVLLAFSMVTVTAAGTVGLVPLQSNGDSIESTTEESTCSVVDAETVDDFIEIHTVYDDAASGDGPGPGAVTDISTYLVLENTVTDASFKLWFAEDGYSDRVVHPYVEENGDRTFITAANQTATLGPEETHAVGILVEGSETVAGDEFDQRMIIEHCDPI